MKKTRKKWIITLILIIILVVLLLSIRQIILRVTYPQKYEEYVEKYARENDLDPLLIYAVIKAESNFNPEVVSSSQAIGLMQLLETTAKEKAEKVGETIEDTEELFNPETNIKLGCAYFAELLDLHHGNLHLAIASYNAGIGKVNSWIEEGTIQKDGSDIENIPYKETNSYVRKIIRDYEIYKQLYAEK